MSEQRELDKLRILFNAVQSLDEESPDFYGELKQCAWDILHENPGTEFSEWTDMLMEQYPTEIVDALGTDPTEVFPALSDLWDTNDFTDDDTGECHTFAEWSEYFATDRSVELYDLLVEARGEIKRLKSLLYQKQVKPTTEATKSGRGRER